jgi:hypothetical protein
MKAKGCLPMDLVLEPDDSISHPNTLLKIHFNPSNYAYIFQVLSSLQIFQITFCTNLSSHKDMQHALPILSPLI